MTTAKIIAISDDAESLAQLKRNLEEYRFEILTASTGIEGVLKAIQFHPDLIVVDIIMPKVSGWEVCEKIKLLPSTMDIPIVFLSEHSSENESEKAKALGAVGYLTKPVDVDAFLTILLKILHKKNT